MFEAITVALGSHGFFDELQRKPVQQSDAGRRPKAVRITRAAPRQRIWVAITRLRRALGTLAP